MYSTCIFCGTRLGRNEVVEAFPVGRRVAFDPAKGRLWALCPRCRQWNLSPLEERWEALESLERLWRGMRARYSTEQIGLARHLEGLEVVRIGRATLPEYAAWRYGGELLRRRRRAVLATGGLLAVGAVAVGGAGAGLVASGGWAAFNILNAGVGIYRQLRPAARVELQEGACAILRDRHARFARLERGEGDGWRLAFPYVGEQRGSWLQSLRWSLGYARISDDPVAELEGPAAVRAAARILPALNRAGASSGVVTQATRFVEEARSPEAAFRMAAGRQPSAWKVLVAPIASPQKSLYRLPAPVRLGLELAAQEESERAALDGELARLEREWREAEEVAAIADDLLVPDGVRRVLDRGGR